MMRANVAPSTTWRHFTAIGTGGPVVTGKFPTASDARAWVRRGARGKRGWTCEWTRLDTPHGLGWRLDWFNSNGKHQPAFSVLLVRATPQEVRKHLKPAVAR